MNERKVFDLEERLIDYAVLIIKISRTLPNTPEGLYFTGQIVRSGPAAALNYGEAQAAESRRDFIHKSKIVLKELRETLVSLKIIKRAELIKDMLQVDTALVESNELVSIFVKSIKTAKENLRKKPKDKRPGEN